MDKGKCPFIGVKFIKLPSDTTNIRRGIRSKPIFPIVKEFFWSLTIDDYSS